VRFWVKFPLCYTQDYKALSGVKQMPRRPWAMIFQNAHRLTHDSIMKQWLILVGHIVTSNATNKVAARAGLGIVKVGHVQGSVPLYQNTC